MESDLTEIAKKYWVLHKLGIDMYSPNDPYIKDFVEDLKKVVGKEYLKLLISKDMTIDYTNYVLDRIALDNDIDFEKEFINFEEELEDYIKFFKKDFKKRLN